MPVPRRVAPENQLNLFHPTRPRPMWATLPAEVRQVAMRLMVQLLRDHRRGQILTRQEQEVPGE